MLKTRDCVNALIEWSTANYDSLAVPADWDFVGEKRMAFLSKGHTKVGNWKRRAIKKNGDATYRLFDNSQTLFPLCMQFLVVEENGAVTDIITGEDSDFVSYFNKIGYNWGGWS